MAFVQQNDLASGLWLSSCRMLNRRCASIHMVYEDADNLVNYNQLIQSVHL